MIFSSWVTTTMAVWCWMAIWLRMRTTARKSRNIPICLADVAISLAARIISICVGVYASSLLATGK